MKISAALAIILSALCACAPATCGSQETAAVGILVITEGEGHARKKAVDSVVKSGRLKIPAEIVYGGTDMRTLQSAITRLESRRIEKIIVVPLFYSSYSETLNHIRFMLGIRKKPSPAFMKSEHSKYPAAALKRVKTALPLTMTNAIDADPAAQKAVEKKVRPILRDPSETSLILVSIGPRAEQESRRQLKDLETIAGQVKKSLSLREAHAFILPPDNDRKIKEKSEGRLRSEVRRLSTGGRVIVAAHSLSERDLDRGIKNLLEGTFYAWAGTAILTSEEILAWLSEKTEEGIRLPPMRKYDDAGRRLKSGSNEIREGKEDD